MRYVFVLLVYLGMTLAASLVVCAQVAAPPPPPAATTLLGKDTPLSIVVGDLKTPGWMMFYPTNPPIPGEMPVQNVRPYATRDEVKTLGNMQYLIAYQLTDPGTTSISEAPDISLPAPVTEGTPLTLCLLDLQSFGDLNNLAPYSQAWLDDLNVHRGADPASREKLRRQIPESTLVAHLQQIRNAINQFQADTGVYPARLEDLVATTAPTVGGGGKAIPADSYKGPYLDPKGGINNTGLPVNPFAKADDPNIPHHWNYMPDGAVISAVDGVTADGVPFGNL